MPNKPPIRISARITSARIACLGLASIWAPHVTADVIGSDLPDQPGCGCGGPEDPIEVILPPEVQAMLFHSLPIAGMYATPDAIAERVLTIPRSRAAAGPPITGKGTADSIPESGAAGTHADPSH
jgi:hypothetical protein